MQEDHLKLEETCVMVTGDDLQEIGNLKTNKVHTPSKMDVYLVCVRSHSRLTSIMFSIFRKQGGGKAFLCRRSLQESKSTRSLQYGMRTIV